MPENNKVENQIKKVNVEINDKLNDLLKETKGYSRTVQDNIITPEITNLELDSYGINNVSNVQDTLFNLRGRDKYTGERVNDMIFANLYGQDSNARSLIQETIKPRLMRNLEYNYILNNMVEISNSLDALAEDTVFPNNGESGIVISFQGNRDIAGERDKDLEKYFRPKLDISSSLKARRIFSFDIEEEVRGLVFNLATYGYQIACTIPYKKIAQDLLYNADKEKEILQRMNTVKSESGDYFVNENNLRGFAEGMYDLYEKKGFGDTSNFIPAGEFNLHQIGDVGNKIEDLNHLFNNTAYTGEDVDEMIYAIKENQEVFSGDYSDGKNFKGVSEDGSFTGIDLLEELKKKKSKKFIMDNIKGSTFEWLDINKTQPIFIKDQLIGAYVVDVMPEMNKYQLGNSLTNLINSSNIQDGLELGDKYRSKIRSMLLGDIEKVLRRNIDKSFLRNNPNLIEDIEWIIDSQGVDNTMNNKIRFIPAEYLTLFKIGPGALGQSLLMKSRTYALMHIQVNKSDALNKVFSKPRYKLTVRDTGNVNSMTTINKAVMTARNQIPRLTDVGIPDTMTDSLLANYQTILVHQNQEGNESVSIDQIPLQEPRDNSEYLRHLRNQATLSLGYPADLLDPSQNVDYAKKITQINLRTRSRVVSIQNAVVMSLSELCTKRLRYITGLENVEVNIDFVPPKELIDNSVIEGLDRVARYQETYELFIDSNPEYKDEEKVIMKAKLAKKLLGDYLDFDILDEIHHKSIIEGTEI